MSQREIPWKRDETFAVYVRKFRSIFDMHAVSFGSREDLGEFVQQLRENRHLAMDFWALVGALSGREGGPLPDEAMLALVVESVAGSEVTTADGEWGGVVKTLASLLAGVDLEAPMEEKTEVSRDGRASAAGGARGEGASTVVTAKAYPLDEALLRIEQSSLELKLHLDKIDDRMRRIEPHLEELSLRVSSAVSPPRRGGESGRLVLEPVGLRAEEPTACVVPMEGYAEGSEHRGVVVVFVLLLLLVAGGVVAEQMYGGVLWQRYGVSARERLLGWEQRIGGGRSHPAVAETAGGVAGGGVAGAGTDGVATGKVEGFAAAAPTVATSAAGMPVGARDAGGVPARRRAMAAAGDSAGDFSGDSFGDMPMGLVQVAPSIMADYLVESRVPAYPEVAKRDEVQGPVVMQATVSPDGFVTAARVVTGERVLRSAALDAVRTWRYRPYLLHGEPTAVSTSITIDFRLNR